MSSKFLSGQTSKRFIQETLSFHFDISQRLKSLVFCFMARAEIGRKWRPKPWTVQRPPSSGRIGQGFFLLLQQTKQVVLLFQ